MHCNSSTVLLLPHVVCSPVLAWTPTTVEATRKPARASLNRAAACAQHHSCTYHALQGEGAGLAAVSVPGAAAASPATAVASTGAAAAAAASTGTGATAAAAAAVSTVGTVAAATSAGTAAAVAAGMAPGASGAAAVSRVAVVVVVSAAVVLVGPWRRARRAARAPEQLPKDLWQPAPQWLEVVPHQPLHTQSSR